MSPPFSHSTLFADPVAHRVPAEETLRERIRSAAEETAATLRAGAPPDRLAMEAAAGGLCARLSLAREFHGFALLSLSNAVWRPAFAATPPGRRLLVLPRCLRRDAACAGSIDGDRLRCARCGACALDGIIAEADALGYRVLIAEGTPAVLHALLEEPRQAILGVACLDALARVFPRVAALGVPHLALPLLRDGCRETEVERDRLSALLRLRADGTGAADGSFLPLLRFARSQFAPHRLQALLGAERLDVEGPDLPEAPLAEGEALALGWLGEGGKRLRPFVTLAAYAAGRYGQAALDGGERLEERIPDSVCRVALAMEVLHKASLVHDDIEDGDALRYGQPTLHQRHGIPLAINAGDHLIGLGYRLIATQADAVGARCAAELCALLAEAHLRLCRGQAAELLWWRGRAGRTARPIDLLAVYAHKTAPAFEASLASGLRLADASPPERFLRAYCRAIGVAYQILDDLAEWRMPEGAGADAEEAGPAGRDLLAGRPTLLHALAMEHAGSGQARRLEAARGGEEGAAPAERLNEARRLYAETGAFDRARRLVEKYRARAAGLTRELEGAAVRRLLQALADLVLAPDG